MSQERPVIFYEFKTKMWIAIGSVVQGGMILVFWFYMTQTVWVKSDPYRRVSIEPSKTLVVGCSEAGVKKERSAHWIVTKKAE